MQVDQRVFLAANSSVKLCCACACMRDPHSQSVSGNVHPEPVNIWVCLQSASHQTCSCARIAWMLFVSITSAETALALVWSIFCGQMVCSRLHCVPVTDSFDDLWISRLYWCDESSALSRPTWDTCLHFAQHIHACLFLQILSLLLTIDNSALSLVSPNTSKDCQHSFVLLV